MIGLVVLAGVSYTQYWSLNQISAEYKQLKELVELVEKGASLQSKYTLRYEAEGFEFDEVEPGKPYIFRFQGPSHCVIYVPYDNFTLDLVLSNYLESYVPINVQEGNVFDLETNETAPVIWSVNATAGWSIYSVPLASEGCYTISLFGPIIIDPFGFMFRMPVEDVECEMWFRVLYEGNYSPFIVIPRPH